MLHKNLNEIPPEQLGGCVGRHCLKEFRYAHRDVPLEVAVPIVVCAFRCPDDDRDALGLNFSITLKDSPEACERRAQRLCCDFELTDDDLKAAWTRIHRGEFVIYSSDRPAA
jgi:hypothetical protein